MRNKFCGVLLLTAGMLVSIYGNLTFSKGGVPIFIYRDDGTVLNEYGFYENQTDPVQTGEIVFRNSGSQRFWTKDNFPGKEVHFSRNWIIGGTMPSSGLIFSYAGLPKQAVSEMGDFYSEGEVTLTVQSISFNWDNSGTMSDGAINIRHDLNTPVSIPEYQSTFSINDPVAYIRSTPVTIKVIFNVTPTSITSLDIMGVSDDINGSLGSTDIVHSVNFTGGISDEVTFDVGTAPHEVRLSDDVWRWGIVTESGFIPMASTGPHRIYTILEMPVAPWDQSAGSDQNPWASALEYSCAWAEHATSEPAAAGGVASSINGLKNSLNEPVFTYDMDGGATHYRTGSLFELTQCLNDINSDNSGFICNCSDCANFVTTFSNLLGCALWSGHMSSNFDLNEIVAIGQPSFGCPNWGCGFSYHAVAWAGNCASTDNIYDACLKVDGNGDPMSAPRTPLLPINMLFSDDDASAPYVYRESLTPAGASGYERCLAEGSETALRLQFF